MARVDAVRVGGETRLDVIRKAIDAELARREADQPQCKVQGTK